MDKEKIKAFFNRLADGWDAQLETDGAKIDEILNAAGLKSGDAVLDIACGTGVLFDFYLARGAARITGVDMAQGMLGKAQEKYGGNERVTLLCADAELCPFEGQYDCCMVFNAFPHFGNPEALLQNLKSALKVGGTLTVAHDWGRAALDTHHKKEASEVSQGLMDENELAGLFERCGFSNIYIKADEGIYIVTGVKA